MRKVEFLEIECLGEKVSAERVNKKLDIFTYTSSNLQFGRKQENGKFKLISEDEMAKEYLENGKGVCYKGYVYFQANKIANNEHFQKLNDKQKRSENELNRKINEEYQTYLNGSLYDAIKEISHFSMVKSMITLYQTGVFSLELLELKLKTYLKPEGVQVILYEVHQSVEMAG